MLSVNRRAVFWPVVVAALLGVAVGAPADSHDQPSIEIRPEEAKPGEEITVTGECWGECDGSPVPDRVVLLLKGTDLADDFIEPDKQGSFELDVELPEELEEGEYKLVAEGPDGMKAHDTVRVAQRDSEGDGGNGGGQGGDGNGGGGDDNPDRARARDKDDCEDPPATDSAEADPAAEEPSRSEACATPPPTAPAGPFVLGESEDSDGGSDGDSSSQGQAGGDDGDQDDGDGGDGRDGDKRDLKDSDNDSDEEDDENDDGDDNDDDSGGGGGGKDRGQGDASAPPTDTAQAATGPAPDDLRQPVPWALIGVLGALFAIGLGATYHVVGRWAPDPADVG